MFRVIDAPGLSPPSDGPRDGRVMWVGRRSVRVAEPTVSTETKITIGCMFLGLTGWYLAGRFLDSEAIELLALFGLGVVLPALLNERRRRAQ